MSEYSAADAYEAVARGAAWMDEKCPDWASEINLEELDLTNGYRCILGQTATCLAGKTRSIYDGYARVVRRLGVNSQGPWVVQHGFQVPWLNLNLTSEEETVAYEMLTIAWKELIRERLAARA